jgi:hypothetical protein
VKETVKSIDPIFEIGVIRVWFIVWLTRTTRESVGTVSRTWDVNEDEMECEDRNNPTVDTGARGDVGVSEHTLYVAGIHFNDEVPHANQIQTKGADSAEKTIDFEFWLGEARFTIIE